MSDFAQMEKALGAAAAAGDVPAAQKIAAEMRRMLLASNPEAGTPDDPRVAASKMAAKGMSGWEAAAVGAGRTADKLIAGVEQIGQLTRTLPTGSVPLPPEQVQKGHEGLARLSAEQAEKDVAFSGVRQERPFSSMVGSGLPYLGVPASMGVLPAAGLIGGGEALQYGSPEERATKGLLGMAAGAVGGYAGKAVGGLLSPVRPGAITQTQSAALRAGEKLGISPRLSEVTGSRFLARMEDMAARTPGGAGIMDDFARGNAQAVNRAAARSIGESADELTPSVFASARARIVAPFEAVKSLPGRPIQITPNVGMTADDILRSAQKMTPNQRDANLVSLAQQAKVMAANKGRIDGEAYQLLRSGLSEASFDASGTNKVLYGKLLDAVDDAAEQSLKAAGKGDLAAALRISRPQYKNLLNLERGLVAEGGNVSPARLGSVLRQQSPSAMREGKGGELFDIARYGESFKPLRAGSPTYEREASSDILGLAVKAPLAWGTAKLTTSPLLSTYPGYLATNPQAALLAQQAGLLASPTARGASMGLLNAYLQ